MCMENDFPGRITIELTNSCNLNCSFCPRHLVSMDQGYMGEHLFRKILEESLMHLPIGLVLFFRGESLLHPQLPHFIQLAKELGFGPIQLASNGLLMEDGLADQLLDSGLDFLSFSLDTLDGALYKESRKNGDLDRSIRNVVQFAERCRMRQSNGQTAPQIQVSTVDIPEYRNGQSGFIVFWLKHVDRVRVYVEHSSDGDLGSIRGANAASQDRKPCKKVFTDVVINWNGDVGICNHDWDRKDELGNVNTQSIASIWNSEKYREIREYHTENRFPKGFLCSTCDHWQVFYAPEGIMGKVYTR